MTEQLFDKTHGLLTGAMTTSQLTLPLSSSDAALFPADGIHYRVNVDGEIMLVTGKTGTNLTVVRGQEGTSGIAHSTGAIVRLVGTAAGMNQWFDDRLVSNGIVADGPQGTASLRTLGPGSLEAMPGDGNTGTSYYGATFGNLSVRPTTYGVGDTGKRFYALDEDGGTHYFWNGTSWLRLGRPVGGKRINPRMAPYLCKADPEYYTDGSMTHSSAVVSLPSATLDSTYVGKAILVEQAGTVGTSKAKTVSGQNTLTLTWITLKIVAASGTFTITFNGQTTSSGIAYNASAATVQAALEGLSSIGAGNVTVSLLGTTYTITLLSGASSTDTTLFSADKTNLVGAQNGAPKAATVTVQLWSYGDVGKRVQVPGAGTSGGLLDAYIGSIDVVNSNIAYLYSLPPTVDGVQGTAVNASATLAAASYYLLSWKRSTITAIDAIAKTVTLASAMDANVQSSLTGLQVYLGTDDLAPPGGTGLQAALTDAVAQGAVLDLEHNNFLISGDLVAFLDRSSPKIVGDGAGIITIVTDSETTTGRLAVGSQNDTATQRAKESLLRGFTWAVPAAHYRGISTLSDPPIGLSSKVNSGGVLVRNCDYNSVHQLRIKNNYAVALHHQQCRYGMVTHSECIDSWADAFHISNTNGVYNGSDWGDFTYAACTSIHSGDDNFTINQHLAGSTNAPSNIMYVGCRVYNMRQNSLGRGFNIIGGHQVTISGCQSNGTSGPSLNIMANPATNFSLGATVSTPGTGAQVVFASPPNNITAGSQGASTTTQMQVFNGSTGQFWIGDVTAISGDGLTLTLTARADQATTCPFTGTNLYCNWGTTSDGNRFGWGGCTRLVVDGFVGLFACLNIAGDNSANGAVALRAGNCSTQGHKHMRMSNLILRDTGQSGVAVRDALNATSDVASTRSTLVKDLYINGLTTERVGYSSITTLRPWAGVNIMVGQDIHIKNWLCWDTADQALLVANSNVAGDIEIVEAEGRDIGRAYSTGSPLAYAFDFGTSTSYNAIADRLRIRNPAGTSGGTQYVCTNGIKPPPNGSTLRSASTDITIGAGNGITTALIDETVNRWWWIASSFLARGKGSPNGVVTANPGAVYQRTDGAAGTSVYIKEVGTDANGWTALVSAGGNINPGALFRASTQTATWTPHSGDPMVQLVDTTSGAFTATMSGSFTAGDVFIFIDKAGTFATNNLTIAPGSTLIDGVSGNVNLARNNQTYGIWYDGTQFRQLFEDSLAPPKMIHQSVSATATLKAGSAPTVLTDTTSAAFTLNLPAAPQEGSSFVIIDDTGQWNTHNLTVGRNGKLIDGNAANLTLSSQNGRLWLLYNGTTWQTIAAVPDTSRMAATATLDSIATAHATAGDVSLNTHKLTNVTDPTSAQDGATKNYVDTKVQLPDDFFDPNPGFSRVFDTAALSPTAAWTPTFMPINPQGHRTYSLQALLTHVNTLFAGSTIGIAVYSIVYAGAQTFTATLVASLAAGLSGASAGIKTGNVNSAPVTLDFTANDYIIGVMVSDATTLKVHVSGALFAGLGCMRWSTTARTSATDWPASFTQTSVAAMAAASTDKIIWAGLLTPSGKTNLM